MHHESEARRLPAIVFGVDELVTLGIMSGFHRAGIPVVGLSHHPDAVGFSSRYCSTALVCPSIFADPGAVLRFLVDRVPRGILVPSYDPFPVFLCRYEAELRRAGFELLMPELEAMLDMTRKDRLATAGAADPDLPVPVSRVLAAEDLERARAELRFPCVLKVVHEWNKDNRIVDRPEDLASGYGALVDKLQNKGVTDYRILAQEWISGNKICFVTQLVDQDGRRLCGMVARRIRANRSADGAEHDSTVVERVDEPELQASAERFARRHGLRGLMELECKFSEIRQRFELLDANLRFWAWNSFALRQGLNYPEGYYCAALRLAWKPELRRRTPRYHWRVFAFAPSSPDLYAVLRLWRLGRQTARELLLSWLSLILYMLAHPRGVSLDFGELRDPVPRLRIMLRMVRDLWAYGLSMRRRDPNEKATIL